MQAAAESDSAEADRPNTPDTVIESLESDTVSVRDGSFVEGAPAASADTALPRIVSLTGPPAVTNGGTAVLRVTLSGIMFPQVRGLDNLV